MHLTRHAPKKRPSTRKEYVSFSISSFSFGSPSFSFLKEKMARQATEAAFISFQRQLYCCFLGL
jgi:hypothetical protein